MPLLPPRAVILGPMAGVTEAPFRAICKLLGASLTYTEMVAAQGLHYNPEGRIARTLLTFSPEETPCGVQIFGADAGMMAEIARGIVERAGGAVALVDINMGCPVAKVVKKGEGSALMRTPELAAEIVRRVAQASPVPVTVKFRSGWDERSVNAVEFARVLQDAGAAGLAVHGRTRSQFYRGRADWEVIAAVKRAVKLPVIGSGDVFSALDARAMFERTGVDAVMVARGARGNPWIFREARALLDRGETIPPPTPRERIEMARAHAAALAAFAGERAAVRMRKHVAWYMTGLNGAARLRERVNRTRSVSELDAVLIDFRSSLGGGGPTL